VPGWLAQLDALSLFAAALLLLLVIGSLTQRFRPGPAGVALTEVLAIFLPALLWSRTRRHHALARLGLRALPPAELLAQLCGGVFLGAALFAALALWIEPIIERLVPVPASERQQLLRMLHPPTGLRPFWQDLLCFAAAPAFCEEVLFRGAILSALRRVSGPGRGAAARAVFVCALLFGAFHLSVAKFFPTLVLGVGFGAAAVSTGSLWPAIVMHLVNNGIVILLVRSGHEDPPVRALSPAGALVTAAALGSLAIGLLLLRRRGANAAPPHDAGAVG
jgi:membrane protease YdiL (CAAX protease family)